MATLACTNFTSFLGVCAGYDFKSCDQNEAFLFGDLQSSRDVRREVGPVGQKGVQSKNKKKEGNATGSSYQTTWRVLRTYKVDRCAA